MKFNLIVKPEGTQCSASIISYFQSHEASGKLEPLTYGLMQLRENALLNEAIRQSSVEIRKGIFTLDILKLLYSDYLHSDPIVFAQIVDKYCSQPFWEVEADFADDPNLFAIMDEVKGRMSNDHPDKAYGLRGHLLNKKLNRNKEFYASDQWKNTGNFIHIPSSPKEVVNCGKVLRLEGKDIFEIWDAYKLFDRDLFLSEERTIREASYISTKFPSKTHPRLIDLACGNGRMSAELLKRGYSVFGVDFDGLETEKAENLLPQANFEVSNLNKLNLPPDSLFDIAVFQYGSFVEMSIEQIISFFQKVRNSLTKEGTLVIDLLDFEYIKMASNGVIKDLTLKLSLGARKKIRNIKRLRELQNDIEHTVFYLEYNDGTKKEISIANFVPTAGIIRHLLTNSGFQRIHLEKNSPERINIICHNND